MTTPTETEPTTSTETAPDAPEPTTFDADYVKKLRDEAAKYRTEAKANSAAATQLAALEESQKTEGQKLIDRVAAAEKEALDAKGEALRWKVAASHGISDEDAELFLTGTDEATLKKQAERLTQRVVEQKKAGNVVPREGHSPAGQASGDPATEFARFMNQSA